MAIIDTRPQIVDIKHYAGDTLALNITTEADYTGATWSGQVRASRAAATSDAVFTFTPTLGGVVAELAAADTNDLVDLGAPVTENAQTFDRYVGVYDIQALTGGVVTTLIRGTIWIDSDVTKAP